MMLFDAHVHLQQFGDDVAHVIDQANRECVTGFACNGTREEDWESVAALAAEYCSIVPFLGLHPWYVESCSPDWLFKLEQMISSLPAGIGEIGLDRVRKDQAEGVQEEVFRKQLELAKAYKRPVTIHCLKAWEWLIRVLKDEKSLPCGFLLHSYSGSAELIGQLLELGAYFSFSANILGENRERARKALLWVPRDRLLIETDSPYLRIPFNQSKDSSGKGSELQNEPANLPIILAGVAKIVGQEVEELSQRIAINSNCFFGSLIHTS